jgi:hypothetical protein
LHDDGACSDAVAMADIANLQLDEIASPQRAIDAKVEQRQFPSSTVYLQPDTYCPNLPELEWCLLAH